MARVTRFAMGGGGSCSGARIHRGSGQAVPPAGYCQPLPCPWAARPSTPPRPLRAAAEPAALLALQSRSAAFRKALKLSSKFCSREAVVNRPWPRALPANTPRGRREEGVTEETDEQHQLLPLSLFLKEQRALFLKGRRELIHRHTHTHTLGITLPSRTCSSPVKEAALAPTTVNTPSDFLMKPIKSISHGAGRAKTAPARSTSRGRVAL